MNDLFRVSRLELRTETINVSAMNARTFMDWLVDEIGQTRFANAPQEVAWVVTLDSHARVYTLVEVGRGTPRSVHAHLPTMLQAVLTAGVERFMYIHSHPSGSSMPTQQDIDTTEMIAVAAAQCGIRLEDSLIVTRDPSNYTSLVNAGLFTPSEYTDGTTAVSPSQLPATPPDGNAVHPSPRREEANEEGPGEVRGELLEGVPHP